MNPFSIVLVIFDFILLGCLTFNSVLCIASGIMVLFLHRHALNVLWSSRLLLLTFVALWNIGILFGAVEYIWDAASVERAMCRVYTGLVYSPGHAGVTSTLLFILFQYVPSPSNTDRSREHIEQSKASKILSSLLPSIHIFWKTLLVVSIVFVIQLALLLVDVFLKSSKVPQFIFANYSKKYGRCHQPIAPFSIYALYSALFLIVFTIACSRMYRTIVNYRLKRRLIVAQTLVSLFISIALLMRCIELVAAIVNWNQINHLFRLLSALFDLITSLVIVIFFVMIPIIDTARAPKLILTPMHSEPSMTPERKTTPESTNKSSERLLPKSKRSSSVEFLDISTSNHI